MLKFTLFGITMILISVFGSSVYALDYAPPHYSYEYQVYDPQTGDMKSQKETREGHVVKGYYALKEADGTIREVHYTADEKNGFNADVKRTGRAQHPFSYVKRSQY